jgi:hypothetical protein
MSLPGEGNYFAISLEKPSGFLQNHRDASKFIGNIIQQAKLAIAAENTHKKEQAFTYSFSFH